MALVYPGSVFNKGFRLTNQVRSAGSFTLSSHVAAGLINAGEFDSHKSTRLAAIKYQVQLDAGPNSGIANLSVTPDAGSPLFSDDTSALLAQLAMTAGKAPTVSGHIAATMQYDLRALAYTLGYATAAGMWHVPVPPNPGVVYSSLATGYSGIANGDFVMGAGVINTDDEAATFLTLASYAGITEVRLATGRVPVGGAVLQDDALAAFTARCMMLIHQYEIAAGRGAHAVFAFARGVSSVMTLRGHVDEGGFTRACFRQAQYPPSCGYWAPTTNATVFDIAVTSRVEVATAHAYALGCMLAGVRAVVASSEPVTATATDPESRITYTRPHPCILRTCPNPQRVTVADSIPGLSDAIVALFARAPDNLALEYAMPQSHMVEVQNVSPGVLATHDAHLAADSIIPGAWVEPAGLSPTGHAKLPAGPNFSQSSDTVLPMFDYYDVSWDNTTGDAPPKVGEVVTMLLRNTAAREWGASYYFSATFSPENGISYWRPHAQADIRTVDFGAAVTRNGVKQTLGNMRWHTPHNPLPSMGECEVALNSAMITYMRGPNDISPTSYTWVKASVKLSVSKLSVTAGMSTDLALSTNRKHQGRYGRHYAAAMRLQGVAPPRLAVFTKADVHGWAVRDDPDGAAPDSDVNSEDLGDDHEYPEEGSSGDGDSVGSTPRGTGRFRGDDGGDHHETKARPRHAPAQNTDPPRASFYTGAAVTRNMAPPRASAAGGRNTSAMATAFTQPPRPTTHPADPRPRSRDFKQVALDAAHTERATAADAKYQQTRAAIDHARHVETQQRQADTAAQRVKYTATQLKTQAARALAQAVQSAQQTSSSTAGNRNLSQQERHAIVAKRVEARLAIDGAGLPPDALVYARSAAIAAASGNDVAVRTHTARFHAAVAPRADEWARAGVALWPDTLGATAVDTPSAAPDSTTPAATSPGNRSSNGPTGACAHPPTTTNNDDSDNDTTHNTPGQHNDDATPDQDTAAAEYEGGEGQ